MIQRNFIHVSIPQQFDFHKFNIHNEDDIFLFLLRMCKESVNKPIIRNEQAIGIIQSAEVNASQNGIVCNGIIWCGIGNEFVEKSNEFSFSAIVID